MSSIREPMNREMSHINVLAGEIGFRVATTEGEHRAANYIEHELQSYELQDVRQEPFPCMPEAIQGILPYIVTVIGASLLAPLLPLIGLGGMIAPPAIMFAEMRSRRGLITRILSKGTSHNVIGILPARGERKRRVVLMAHY